MPDFVEPIGLKKGKHLDELEHKSIEEPEYKPKLKELQLQLLNFQREISNARNSLIIIFEGPDAAGKGARSSASRSGSTRGSRAFIPPSSRPRTNTCSTSTPEEFP